MAAGELGMWDWDVTTNRMNYSERAKAIYGFPLDEPVTYEQVRDATHPDDLPLTTAQAARSLDPVIRERRPYEYRLVRPDGEIRWVLAYGQAVFEEKDGKITATRYIGTIQDITARTQMEQDLRATAARLSLALTAGQMAVCEIDPAGLLKTSPELKRFLGFGEIENPSMEDIRSRYFPGELERLQETVRRSMASGEHIVDVEFRCVWPDQSLHWLWVRAQLNPQGIPNTAIGVVQDFTERKSREQHIEALLHELSHRTKNLLAVVQAVTRQTVRSSTSPADFERAMLGRVQALASAHDLLLKENWRGAEISEVIASQLQAFTEIDRQRIGIQGPEVLLRSSAAQDLSISIYELATNAVKYGALSVPGGRVSITWHIDSVPADTRILRMSWAESGGPVVETPRRRGFGVAVLGRVDDRSGGRGPLLKFPAEGIRWTREWMEPEFSPRSTAEEKTNPAVDLKPD